MKKLSLKQKMASKIITAVLVCGLLGGCGGNYFPQKEVQYKNVVITWYFQYVGDSRRDYVKVEKGSEREVVLECIGTPITNINVVNNSVIVRLRRMATQNIYKRRSSGMGIPVLIDSTASEYEWDRIYNAGFYEMKDSAAHRKHDR